MHPRAAPPSAGALGQGPIAHSPPELSKSHCVDGPFSPAGPVSEPARMGQELSLPASLDAPGLLALASMASTGCMRGSPTARGTAQTHRVLAGLPPCEGPEGREGSRVSRQPLIQLQTSDIHETLERRASGFYFPGVSTSRVAAGQRAVREVPCPQQEGPCGFSASPGVSSCFPARLREAG